MSYAAEGVKGKLLLRFHFSALKALTEDEMFVDTSRDWAESAAEDLEEHQEKKINKWGLKIEEKKTN